MNALAVRQRDGAAGLPAHNSRCGGKRDFERASICCLQVKARAGDENCDGAVKMSERPTSDDFRSNNFPAEKVQKWTTKWLFWFRHSVQPKMSEEP